MNTLVRNATSNLSRRFDGYQPLDNQQGTHEDYPHRCQRNFSKRRKEPYGMVKSFSYRRNRARHRHIFLKSYTLSSTGNLGQSKSGKLKKAVVKVKTVVVSVVAFMRLDSLRSCNSRTAIAASSPSQLVRKFF